MAREETTFKGKSKEELQSMPLEQAVKLLNSRARRAVKRTSKQNYRFKALLKHVAQIRKAGQKNYRPCGDQFLRNFLKGLTLRVRVSSPGT